MRVFLTGGTGLIGSHLTAELRAHGHEVVALHREGADTYYLEEQECELVEGDVRDDAELLTGAMTGCTHLVHAAALVYARGGWPKVRAVNVEGTRNVLAAAAEAGVGHAIHVSSVAVYGPATPPIDEDTPTDADLPSNDLYARSKREAEEVARAAERRTGMPVAIVRPCAVYGERDRLAVPQLQRILKLPVVPLFGSGDNTVPMVYAGNIAVALRLVMEAGAGDVVYDLGMDHPITQRELLEYLARGLRTRPTFMSIPRALVSGTASVLNALGAKVPGIRHLPLKRLARLVLDDNPYSSLRIRDALGWEPPHEHRDALERAGHWGLNNN